MLGDKAEDARVVPSRSMHGTCSGDVSLRSWHCSGWVGRGRAPGGEEGAKDTTLLDTGDRAEGHGAAQRGVAVGHDMVFGVGGCDGHAFCDTGRRDISQEVSHVQLHTLDSYTTHNATTGMLSIASVIGAV